MGDNKVARCRRIVRVVDAAVALFFVSPLVVAYWRGCWQLMDLLLFPENVTASVFSSVCIGIVAHLVLCVAQDFLAKNFSPGRSMVLFLLVSRLYNIVFSIACVNHWRGIWQAWDLYTGTTWHSGLLTLFLGFLLLVVTSSVGNILAPPFVTVPDKPQGFFRTPTLFDAKFNTQVSKCYLYT